MPPEWRPHVPADGFSRRSQWACFLVFEEPAIAPQPGCGRDDRSRAWRPRHGVNTPWPPPDRGV